MVSLRKTKKKKKGRNVFREKFWAARTVMAESLQALLQVMSSFLSDNVS